MIVIVHERNDLRYMLSAGDKFQLDITSNGEKTNIISEEITELTMVTYAATFRFCDSQGYCMSPHLVGFFGNKDLLPIEIRNAVRVKDLTNKQRANFLRGHNANN